MQHLRFTSSDGLELAIRHWPGTSSDLAPCLLLHGFSNQAEIWQSLAQELQALGHSVYALDFRGHGLSAWDPNCDYSHQRLALDVEQCLGFLQLEQLHLIGHSLGARVATLLIAQLQQKQDHQVLSFCIADTGPEVRAAGVAKVRQDAEAMPATFASPLEYWQLLKRIYLLADEQAIKDMAHYSLRAMNCGNFRLNTDPEFTRYLWNPQSYEHNANDLRAPLNDELWQAMGQIQSPCLILRGQMSAILAPRTAKKMATEVIPEATLEVIPTAGHAIMLDNSQAFNRAVSHFLNRVEAA